MNMKDFSQMADDRRAKAFELLGFAQGMLESVRNGVPVRDKTWKMYDELRLAYECSCRDLDQCLDVEATVNSIKEG